MKNNIINLSKDLKKREDKLINSFLNGNEASFLYKHARILDNYFLGGFEQSNAGAKLELDNNPCAIIALGGYGRQEQCVYSDVDILFLFDKEVPKVAAGLVRDIVYPLWDIGIEVAYSTRSIDECVDIAANDFKVLTSLFDARFICGMSFLYLNLLEELNKKIISQKSKKIMRWLVETNKSRHDYFGNSAYMLEPNIKRGRGGLRDYHTIRWIAHIKFQVKQFRDLEYKGCLSNDEFFELRKSLSFIWNVRNRLHYFAKRKCDQLYMEYQVPLAKKFNFEQIIGRRPVEVFLGKLHTKMDFIKQLHTMFLYEHGVAGFELKKNLFEKTRIKGLVVINGFLNFNSSEDIIKSPKLLIKIFEESAGLKIPLSAEAKRLVKEFLYLINDKLRNSSGFVKSFEKIMLTLAPIFNILNQMLSIGFLVKFIPEIKDIISLQ